MAMPEKDPISPGPEALDSKMGPMDDLRDREFPVPDSAPRTPTGPIAEYRPMAPGDTRQGGKVRDGDKQNAGSVQTVFDQDEATPDLAQEAG